MKHFYIWVQKLYVTGYQNSEPAKPVGRIKLTSNKTRTSNLMVALLNANFLRKHEEIWSCIRNMKKYGNVSFSQLFQLFCLAFHNCV